MKLKLDHNSKQEWKLFHDEVNTIDELQEALDVSSDFITLYVVNSVDPDGVIDYRIVKCDTLDDKTIIDLWGVKFTGEGVTAIVRILSSHIVPSHKHRRPY